MAFRLIYGASMRTFLIAMLMGVVPAAAQKYCDPALPQGSGANGYKERGDRCEGLYFLRTASVLQTINVISFRQDTSKIPQPSARWLLASPVMQSSKLSLRAEALPDTNIYYRMDTQTARGAKSFMWDTRLLASLELTAPQIGIVAWTEPDLASGPGQSNERILVPILMTEAGSETSGTGNLVLSLKLAQRLDRLSLRVYEATTDGRFGSQISSIDVRPNPTYFEPNRAIGPIMLRKPDQAGTFFLEIYGRIAGEVGVAGDRTVSYAFYSK
jgi:hypothetical protein